MTRIKKTSKQNSLWLYGRHTVKQALQNPQRECFELAFLSAKEHELNFYLPDERTRKLTTLRPVEKFFFDKIFPPGTPHQGVALHCIRLVEPNFEDFLEKLSPKAVIIVLDNVSDPRNIGAVLRSAHVLGAKAVLLGGKNIPDETATMAKAASGAIDHIPILRPGNLARSLILLKRAEFWCMAFHHEGENLLHQTEFPERTALVFGSEGKGLRRLTRHHCDTSIRISMKKSNIENLNISNAVAIALYVSCG